MVERSVKSFLIFSVDKINEALDKLQPNFELQVVPCKKMRYIYCKNILEQL